MVKNKFKIIEYLLIPFVFFFTFILRYLSLIQSKYANGWDGYYYLIQVKSYIEEGAMHSSDSSLIYPLLILLSKIFSYVKAYQIGSALISALFCVSFYLLSIKLINVTVFNKNETSQGFPDYRTSFIAIFIALFSIFSPSLVFFSSQFPKNLLGFTFLNFFLMSLITSQPFISARGVFHFRVIWKLKYLILTFILTFMTHRFTAAIAVIVLVISFINYLIERKKIKILLFGLLIVTLSLLISIIFPGTIHFYDIERFKGIFSSTPQMTPVSLVKTLNIQKFNGFWLFEIFFLYFLFIACLIQLFIKRKLVDGYHFKNFYGILMILCFILVFPFYQFDLMGLAYRFFFGFIILCPLLLIPILNKLKSQMILSGVILLFILSFFTKKTYDPKEFDPPYPYYEKISKKVIETLKNTDYDLIVAHKALAEIFTYTTNKDALPWQPEANYKYYRVYRITSDLNLNHFKAFLDDNKQLELIKKLTKRYYLIREDIWQVFIRKVKKNKNEYLLSKIRTWKNPHKKRPKYLLKGKKNN